METPKIIQRVIQRFITVTPPVYGQDVNKYAADLVADNYKLLTTTPGLLKTLEEKVVKYINYNQLHAADPKAVTKMLKAAMEKRVALMRFQLLAHAMGQIGDYRLGELEPKQVMPGHQLESAVHKIAAPHLKPECTVCDMDFGHNKLCPKCVATLHVIEHTKGYHAGKFKNPAQAIRRYREMNPEDFKTYILRKKDYKPPVVRPKVAPQPSRDYTLKTLDARDTPLSRQQKRLEEYIAKIKAEAAKIEQHGDIAVGAPTVLQNMYNMVKSAYDQGVLTVAAAIAVIAAGIGAVLLFLFKRETYDRLVRVLRIVIPILSILAGLGFLAAFFTRLSSVLNTAVEKYEANYQESKRAAKAAEDARDITKQVPRVQIPTTWEEIDDTTPPVSKDAFVTGVLQAFSDIKQVHRVDVTKLVQFHADYPTSTIQQGIEYICLVCFGESYEKVMDAYRNPAPSRSRTCDQPILYAPSQDDAEDLNDVLKNVAKDVNDRMDIRRKALSVAGAHGLPNSYVDVQIDRLGTTYDPDEIMDLIVAQTTNSAVPCIAPMEPYSQYFNKIVQWLTKAAPFVEYIETLDKQYVAKIKLQLAGLSYTLRSRPWRSKKLAYEDLSKITVPFIKWMVTLPEHLATRQIVKIDPHAGDDKEKEKEEEEKKETETSTLVSVIMEAVRAMSEGTTSAAVNISKSTIGYIHTVATAVRDVKSLIDVVQPLVECAVGAFYEHVLQQPWVPWSQRDIVALLQPIMKEHEALTLDGDRTANIHSQPSYQERVAKFIADVTHIEHALMKNKTPPRYLVPVVKMRSDAEHWQQQIVLAKKTAKDRMEPLGIMIFGAPGVGKSTALKQLCVDLAPTFHQIDPQRYPQTWNDNMWFAKKSDTETWDGYKNQPVIFFDDIFQTTDTQTRTKESMMIVSVINRAAFACPMADLPDKGVTYAQPLVVIANRNGTAKLTNLGITSATVITRRFPIHCEMMPGGDPTKPETWKFQLYDQDCTPYPDGYVDYVTLLKYSRAMLVAKHSESQHVVLPTPETKEEIDYKELGLNLLHRHRQATRTAQAASVAAQAEALVGGTKRRNPIIEQQGSGFSATDVDLDAALEYEADLINTQRLLDTAYMTKTQILTLHETLRKRATEFGIMVPAIAVGTYDHITQANLMENIAKLIQEIRENIAQGFNTIRKWTVSKIDAAIEWFSKAKESIYVTVFHDFYINVFAYAKKKFLDWISKSTLAKVCVAIGAAAIVAGAIGGLYLLFKEDPEEEMTQHSRTEKEEKRDRERGRRKEEEVPRHRLRAGKAYRDDDHNAQGKLLPRRMRGHAGVSQHLFEHEMPLLASIARNVYTITYQVKEAVGYGQVVMIRGCIGMTCLHVARYFNETTKVTLRQVYTLNDKTTTNLLEVPPPTVIHVPDTELVFLDFNKTVPMAADITHHFATDADVERMMEYGVTNIRMIYRDREGARQIVESQTGTVDVYSGLHTHDNDVPYLSYRASTTGGSSGGITLTTSPAFERKIFAFHTGASEQTAYDGICTREMIDMFVPNTQKITIVPHIDFAQDHFDVVSPKNQTIPLGVLVHPHSSGGKNAIVPSPLAQYLRQDPVYPMRTLTIPTIMYATDPKKVADRWYREGMIDQVEGLPDMVDPIRTAYTVAPPFKHISRDLMEAAWRDTSIPEFPRGYHILSPEDAVFGVPELDIAPIDFTTSPGYNWANIKPFDRYTLFGCSKNDTTRKEFAQWHPAMQDAITSVLRELAQGNLPLNIVVDSLKAERRKVKRVLAGATRLFYAGSIVWLIVSRMFTACLTAHEKSAPTLHVPAVGIVPTSNEWKEVYMRLAKHPHKIVTDQVNYDMHNQNAIANFIGEKTAKLCLRDRVIVSPGFHAAYQRATNEELTLSALEWGIHASYLASCTAVHIAGSVAYLDTQTTNSGVDRTSQVNSQRNELAIRMVAIDLLLEHINDLPECYRSRDIATLVSENIEYVLYGDDQVISISELFSTFFTKYAYATRTHEITGSVVTEPSKEPITPDSTFDGWDKVELLKRGFAWRDGICYAPLQKSVIEDSLFWVTRASTAHSIAADTVRSALLEAALHGREYYDLLYGVCERACRMACVRFEPLSYEWVTGMYQRK